MSQHLKRSQGVRVQQVALALKQLQAGLVQHAAQLKVEVGAGQHVSRVESIYSSTHAPPRTM